MHFVLCQHQWEHWLETVFTSMLWTSILFLQGTGSHSGWPSALPRRALIVKPWPTRLASASLTAPTDYYGDRFKVRGLPAPTGLVADGRAHCDCGDAGGPAVTARSPARASRHRLRSHRYSAKAGSSPLWHAKAARELSRAASGMNCRISGSAHQARAGPISSGGLD